MLTPASGTSYGRIGPLSGAARHRSSNAASAPSAKSSMHPRVQRPFSMRLRRMISTARRVAGTPFLNMNYNGVLVKQIVIGDINSEGFSRSRPLARWVCLQRHAGAVRQLP